MSEIILIAQFKRNNLLRFFNYMKRQIYEYTYQTIKIKNSIISMRRHFIMLFIRKIRLGKFH